MTKKQLSKKEIEELNSFLPESAHISKKDSVIVKDEKLVFVNDKLMFFFYEKKFTPTLKFLQQNNFLKKITVDMGAVKFVVKGADIMRPGIIEIEEGILAGEIVCVIDSQNKMPLCLGVATIDSQGLRAATSGKVIKNIHYVGDELWKTNF